MPSTAPSPWLRLTALAASAATLVAVISGAASLGAAHQLLSALALPPLVAVLLAAWLEHRRLVVPALVSLALFGAAALITVDGLHLSAAAIAFASTLVLTGLVFRGRPAPIGLVLRDQQRNGEVAQDVGQPETPALRGESFTGQHVDESCAGLRRYEHSAFVTPVRRAERGPVRSAPGEQARDDGERRRAVADSRERERVLGKGPLGL